MILLPKVILDLFPLWEYCCPICNTYIEPPVSFCPSCKTPFDAEKWRVPPRFLKSKKAMSEYAHNVLAPKLSVEKRKYLFKYFTQLFADGFESGNFDAWNPGVSVSNGTATVQSTTKHHGSYGAKFSTNDGTLGNHASVRQNLGAGYATIYFRSYVNLPELNDTNGTRMHLLTLTNLTNGAIASCGLGRTGTGVYQWYIRRELPATVWTFDETPNINQWYCMELLCVIHATAGQLQLWINGVSKINQTGLDTDDRGNIEQVVARIFLALANQASGKTAYHDCVVVADTYIGLEVTEINVTDSGLGAEAISRPERRMILTDSGLGAETITRPERQMIITDLANCLEALFKLRELAAVTDGAAGLELVTVGAAGVIKTKIFLTLGDLAIQLTGD